MVSLVFAGPAGVTPFDYVAEGDSITEFGDTGLGYPDLCANQRVHVLNNAVGGSLAYQMGGRATAVDAITSTGRTISVLIGANDLMSAVYDRTTFLNQILAYFAARTGYLKVICTILPRSESLTNGSGLTFNQERALVRTQFLTWVGVQVNACCDFAANATMGADGANTNLTYYQDGLHPTAAGEAILATMMKTTLTSLGVNGGQGW